jgi:Esterase-like activity of phytase
VRWSRRFFAALAVALLCAPGTFLRTEVPTARPREIAPVKVQGAGPTPTPGWEVAGVWQYDADSLLFGGFSALLALGDHQLRAFSDRGARFTLTEPDRPAPEPDGRPVLVRQLVVPAYAHDLWDIESATRDPVSARYWLAYENHHAIYRFTVASAPDGIRDLENKVDWTANSGAEAMVRLSDGRFVVLPEGEDYGLIFPGDPVKGAKPARFAFRNPAPGFAATDVAELPDGRLLMVMRDLAWGYPIFTSRLVIGAAPRAGGVFAPETALQLDPTIPRENYEGIAVRPRSDGRIDVWLISDDNKSAMQRTLLAKLVFDPDA